MKTRNGIAALLAIVVILITGCGQAVLPGKRIYSYDCISNYIISTNLDFKDKRKEFRIPEPNPESNYVLNSIFKFYSSKPSFRSISEDKKFIFISTNFSTSSNENANKLTINGRKVIYLRVTEYSIYEPSAREFHYIGASCLYYLEQNDNGMKNIKEVGHKYYPAAWMDDELLLVETTKDEKIYTEGQDASVKTDEITSLEVPYATTRAMSFSLKDFKLSPTDKFKPLKPWTSYSDTQTGIVSYFDPFYPFQKIIINRYPSYYDFTVTTLTDLKCTKTYDLFGLAKKVFPKDYILTNSRFCGAMIDQNGRRMCYYFMEGYHKDILKYNNESLGFPEDKLVIFGLDFDTGKIEKYMNEEQISSKIRELYKDRHKIKGASASTIGDIVNGITMETGPIIIVFCTIIHYQHDRDPADNRYDASGYFCKLVGQNLNKLEELGPEAEDINPPLFIR